MPAFLIWGFWLVTSPRARGAFAALAGWTKFAPLLVAPLWLSYPEGRRRPRQKLFFLIAFAAATLAAFCVLLIEPNPSTRRGSSGTARFGWQIGRESPFSLWDWRQYHAAGIPNLHLVQWVLEGLLAIGSIAVYFFPKRKAPLQLAALTGAILLGFELVLTHWFYLYIPWFFPFAAIALLAAPAREAVTVEDAVPREHTPRTLVPAGWIPFRGRRGRARDRPVRRLVGPPPRRLLHEAPSQGHAALPALRGTDRRRRGAVPRHPARVSARVASLFAVPAIGNTSDEAFEHRFEWMMLFCGRRDGRPDGGRAGRASRRRRPG